MTTLDWFWRLFLLLVMGVLITFVCLVALFLTVHAAWWMLKWHRVWVPLALGGALLIVAWLQRS